MRAAILILARAVRSAETARIEESKRTLDLYDKALHSRVEVATAYLKAVKNADDRYQESVRDALDEFAAALINGEPQRSH